MIKKIAIVLILLSMMAITNIFCEERTIVYVHITADPLVPTYEGSVWLYSYGITFRQDYDIPRTYYFENVCGLSFNHDATAKVVVGDHTDQETHLLTMYNYNFYLHLSSSVPYYPPEYPEEPEE